MEYLRNVGIALDRLINAITGGHSDETVSLRAATHATKQPPKKWACVLCKWLSITVEPDHCARTLDPEAPTKTAACVRAFIQMLAIIVLIQYLIIKL